MSDEYMRAYDEWADIHENKHAYRKHILKSIQDVYTFCREQDIKDLREYVQRWSVSHLTSGVLDENVAYALKVHDAQLTKPEKRLIKKKYLDKVVEIEERMKREKELRKFIEKNIRVVQNKIGQSDKASRKTVIQRESEIEESNLDDATQWIHEISETDYEF